MQGGCDLIRLSVQDERVNHSQSAGSRSNLGSTRQYRAAWPFGTTPHTASSLRKTPLRAGALYTQKQYLSSAMSCLWQQYIDIPVPLHNAMQ